MPMNDRNKVVKCTLFFLASAAGLSTLAKWISMERQKEVQVAHVTHEWCRHFVDMGLDSFDMARTPGFL